MEYQMVCGMPGRLLLYPKSLCISPIPNRHEKFDFHLASTSFRFSLLPAKFINFADDYYKCMYSFKNIIGRPLYATNCLCCFNLCIDFVSDFWLFDSTTLGLVSFFFFSSLHFYYSTSLLCVSFILRSLWLYEITHTHRGKFVYSTVHMSATHIYTICTYKNGYGECSIIINTYTHMHTS